MAYTHTHNPDENSTFGPLHKHLMFGHDVDESMLVDVEDMTDIEKTYWEGEHASLHEKIEKEEAVQMGKRRNKGKTAAAKAYGTYAGALTGTTKAKAKEFVRGNVETALAGVAVLTKRKTPAEIRAEKGVKTVRVWVATDIEVPLDYVEAYEGAALGLDTLEDVLDDLVTVSFDDGLPPESRVRVLKTYFAEVEDPPKT